MLDTLSEKESQLRNMKQRLPDPHSPSFPQTNFSSKSSSIINIGDTSEEDDTIEETENDSKKS